MIGWKTHKKSKTEDLDPKGFDDFELRLGDIMRGERATMGKSLLDVQRELRIKATYIAAIENCDPSAFETPGFIAGYVRSYARYLNIDPDEAFDAFCAESGFSTAHGMSQAASVRKSVEDVVIAREGRDLFTEPALPFAPASDGFMSRVEPGAIGSSLVLVALVAGIGYGGWSVLQEVQRVQVSPVEQTPVVLSDLDPLDRVIDPRATSDVEAVADASAGIGVFNPPSSEALDRLYRPEALDVPVVIARDAPISTLDPTTVGAFAQAVSPRLPNVDTDSAVASVLGGLDTSFPGDLTQTTALPTGNGVTVVAVREAWVRARGSDGSVIYEAVMQPGDTWTVPADEESPVLTAGASGAIYFSVDGQTYGPSGARGSVTQDIPLIAQDLKTRYTVAALDQDEDLKRVVAELAPAAATTTVARALPVAKPGQPRVLEDAAPGVTVVAVRPAWVQVTGPGGSTLYEAIMNAGDTYEVPQLAEAPKIRVGESGAIYFAVNGLTYGPAGARGSVTTNLALAVESLTANYQVADIAQDADLDRVVAELNATVLPGTDSAD